MRPSTNARGRVVADVVTHRCRTDTRTHHSARGSETHRRGDRQMGAESVGEGPGHLDASRPASSTRMVSFPPALPDSPSAVKNIRAASHLLRHCWSVMPAASRWLRLRHNRFPPIVIDGRPAANASSAVANRDRNTATRRVLVNRSPALRYPRRRRRDRPWVSVSATGASSPGRSTHRCSNTSTAARRSSTWAANPRIPSWY